MRNLRANLNNIFDIDEKPAGGRKKKYAFTLLDPDMKLPAVRNNWKNDDSFRVPQPESIEECLEEDPHDQ